MWTEYKQNIIFISDMHIIGDNPICRLDNLVKKQVKKLKFLINFANKHNAIILSAGDQTDTPRNFISFYTLSHSLKKLKTDFFYCLGQHDKYMRSNSPNSISLIEKLGLVKRLGSEPYNISGINIYGCDFGDEPTIPTTKNNILVVHDSITTKELAIKHVDFKEANNYLKLNDNYDIILCGDIHRRFKIDTNNRIIMNSGPMVRKEASTYFMDFSPGFYFLENGEMRFVKIPHDKDVMSRDHIKLIENKDKNILNFSIGTNNSDDIDGIVLSKIKQELNQEELKEIIFG